MIDRLISITNMLTTNNTKPHQPKVSFATPVKDVFIPSQVRFGSEEVDDSDDDTPALDAAIIHLNIPDDANTIDGVFK